MECVLSVYKEPGNLSLSECESLGYEDCQGPDFWAWGMEQCKKDGGSLPTMEQLAKFANAMYIRTGGEPFNITAYQTTCPEFEHEPCMQYTANPVSILDAQFDSNSALAKVLGPVDFNTQFFTLWSSEPGPPGSVLCRLNTSDSSSVNYCGRRVLPHSLVCVK